MGIEEVGGILILLGVAGVAFGCYATYKIIQNRSEIRQTVQVLDNRQIDFVDALESMVSRGELSAVPV